MTLRPYQSQTLTEIYAWLNDNPGDLVCVMPTGSGKSHVIAALCESALKSWPDTRILMLTGQKELIEQNAEKLRGHWPNAPLGLFSASLNRREHSEPITFAGIQSIRKHWKLLERVDLIIVDECHAISHKEEGAYRGIISDLKNINPSLRVVGFTATPYRMGHGLIIEGDALFDGLIEPVSILELQAQGFLSLLKSRKPATTLNTEGVHHRGGEFVEKELQRAVDVDPVNRDIVREIIACAHAESRQHWLIFCTGVEHSHHIRDILKESGISAESVTGKTSKTERERILEDFRSGRIQAVTNANVLSTGFDYPDIDLIAFLRPTESPIIYAQQAGRGLRLKSHTDYCRVLDFSGNIFRHGPITEIIPPKMRRGDGVAPAKLCPECDEICNASEKNCPACGYEFPFNPQEKDRSLRVDDDIMGLDKTRTLHVSGWSWEIRKSRRTQKDMIVCTYYGGLSDKPIEEFFCVWHEGFAQRKGMQNLGKILEQVGISWGVEIGFFLYCLNASPAPAVVEYVMDGKYPRVLDIEWDKVEEIVPF